MCLGSCRRGPSFQQLFVSFFCLSIFFHRQMKRRGEEGWEQDKAKKNNTDTNANSKLDRKGACRAGRGRHEFSLPNTNNKLKQSEKGSIEVGVGPSLQMKTKTEKPTKIYHRTKLKKPGECQERPSKTWIPLYLRTLFRLGPMLRPLPALPPLRPTLRKRKVAPKPKGEVISLGK